METTLFNVFSKPNDFKICKKCGALNWYENKECKECGSKEFKDDKKSILKWANNEFDFWIQKEGYNEEEAINILLNV